MKKLQLFCLPYAGGSASFYNAFKSNIDSTIEMIPIEYSGHGTRMAEELYSTMDDMVEDVVKQIKRKKVSLPYALAGYSMGSTISYELIDRLQKEFDTQLKHVFYIANTAPHIPIKDIDCYKWNDKDFINKIIELGGLPEEILAERELLELFLPILRNDFKCLGCYDSIYKKHDISFSVIYSDADNVDNNISEWDSYSARPINYYRFEGNHFFGLSKHEEIVKIINKTLV